MTLVVFDSGRKLLIDTNIRAAADDPDDETPDVAEELRGYLTRDAAGRLFVDALLISHPDEDHCRGLKKHFHLGKPGDWSKSADKIFIREIWSSPMVFRRASKNHVLCADALAFNTEARRRVQKFRDSYGLVSEGDRILIMGEDEDGKTDDLGAILVRVNEQFTSINGSGDYSMTARLLSPHPKSDEEDEALRSKNHSSVILSIFLYAGGKADACRFLTGGDAEVAIWERLWDEHINRPTWLEYDILQAPHHCSWHSLSYDSWSEFGEDAEVSEKARKALSQTRPGAVIVASSRAIKDDDVDPPCIRAKREYKAIAGDAGGSFKCVGEPESNPTTLTFEIGKEGPRLLSKAIGAAIITGTGVIGNQALGHG